jgi:hypothetical protein
MRFLLAAASCLVLYILPLASAAAETTRTIYLDDDLLSGFAEDSDYTGGAALTFAGEIPRDVSPVGDSAASSPRLREWLSSMDRLLGISSNSYRYEIEIGGAAFTPADIITAEPVTNDRPYAGLVYVAGTLIQDEDAYRSAVTSLAVGVLGSELVPHAQHTVHRWMGSDQPNGWRHQISDGGEATLRLMHERRWASDVRSFAGERVQWVYLAGAGVGFLTDINAGVAVRIGDFSTARWDIHASPTGLSSRAVSGVADPGDRFFYGALSARVPLYNALLQGQFRDSDVTVPSADRRRFVPDATLGYVMGLPKGRNLHYFIRAQLSDVRLAERSDTLVYGGVSLSW